MYNILFNNTINQNWINGIRVESGFISSIDSNNITVNKNGIYFANSDNITIVYNNILRNIDYGIFFRRTNRYPRIVYKEPVRE